MNLITKRNKLLSGLRAGRERYTRAGKARGHREIREAWKELADDKSDRARALRETLREREQENRNKIPLRTLMTALDKAGR